MKQTLGIERLNENIKKTREIFDRDRKRRKLKNIFVIIPLRIVLFPIFFIIKLFRWTYGYDD